jgi:hypothetical protein
MTGLDQITPLVIIDDEGRIKGVLLAQSRLTPTDLYERLCERAESWLASRAGVELRTQALEEALPVGGLNTADLRLDLVTVLGERLPRADLGPDITAARAGDPPADVLVERLVQERLQFLGSARQWHWRKFKDLVADELMLLEGIIRQEGTECLQALLATNDDSAGGRHSSTRAEEAPIGIVLQLPGDMRGGERLHVLGWPEIGGESDEHGRLPHDDNWLDCPRCAPLLLKQVDAVSGPLRFD